jgi:hypothetical protein
MTKQHGNLVKSLQVLGMRTRTKLRGKKFKTDAVTGLNPATATRVNSFVA